MFCPHVWALGSRKRLHRFVLRAAEDGEKFGSEEISQGSGDDNVGDDAQLLIVTPMPSS